MKPLFSDKSIKNESITLIVNDNIIKEDGEIANYFNDFFSAAVENLNIEEIFPPVNDNISDPIKNYLMRYKDHPSIKKISEFTKKDIDEFKFQEVPLNIISDLILSLDNSKAASIDDIPVRIIKENIDLFANKLHIDVNNSLNTSIFPNNLKLASISPTHKSGSRLDISNYRPVSILSPISKIFEKVMYYQINKFMSDKFSPYLSGFRKNHNAQNCLLLMIENWRKALDNKGSAGAILTDLSKAFDCINHKLMLSKLNNYGFDLTSLKLIFSYLDNRYQRVRINNNFSPWSKLISGVPQGSILGPLLFNIYINDIFLFMTKSNMANYADDNTPYSCDKNIETVVHKLQEDSEVLMKYFKNNYFRGNPDKFHLLLSDARTDLSITVNNSTIENSKCEKLLGIKIDSNLKFDTHVENLCKKASQKLHALARVSKYMNLCQRRMIMKSFINSQFGYCPIVWMFHSRSLNNRINSIHERALRLVYNDNTSLFDELLLKDKSVTIHERNIQVVAIELYKVINGIAPDISKEIFQLKSSSLYNSCFPFKTRNVHTTLYGTETLMYLAPKIWSILPNHLKEIKTLKLFKRRIKEWRPANCPCKLCKIYIKGLGFTNIT